jgi:nitrogen fixation protein FixH
MQTKTKKPKEFTGRHMLIIIISFFGVIFSVNFFMAMSAKKAWTGLVVKNTYVASQEYNTKLANANAQHAKGWTSDIKYDAGILTFSLLDGANKPLKADLVTTLVSRPVGTKDDQKLTLTLQENGSYIANTQIPTGTWNIHLIANFENQPTFEHYYKIVIEK